MRVTERRGDDGCKYPHCTTTGYPQTRTPSPVRCNKTTKGTFSCRIMLLMLLLFLVSLKFALYDENDSPLGARRSADGIMGCASSHEAVGDETVSATTKFSADDYEAEATAKNTPEVLEEVTALIGPRYKATRFLGSGHAAPVFACTDEAGQPFAAKLLDANSKHTAEIELLRKLVNIPNTVCLYDVIWGEDHTVLILELCDGGELFLRTNEGVPLVEDAVRVLMRELLRTVHGIHTLGYLHRNIQLENILLRSSDSDYSFRLAGYNLSCTFEHQNANNTVCGAPGYIAPEMILKKDNVGPPIDVWAIGVCAFLILADCYPFNEDGSLDFAQECKNIVAGNMAPWSADRTVSAEAKAFVESILAQTDPVKRPTIPQLLASSWLQSGLQEVPPMLAFDSAGAEGPTALPLAAPAWWTVHDGLGVVTVSTETVTTAAVTVPSGAGPGQPLLVLEPMQGSLVTVVVPEGFFPGMQFPASITTTETTIHAPAVAMSYPTAIPVVQAHAGDAGAAETATPVVQAHAGDVGAAQTAILTATTDWSQMSMPPSFATPLSDGGKGKETQSVVSELQKLAELRSVGALTEEEFEMAKGNLLNPTQKL